MALATRCPHCETVFRLDPHLVAPHDGRVRCGHCQEVFDAAHHRFELPDDAAAAGEAQHAAIIDDEVAVGPSTLSPGNNAEAEPPTLVVPRSLELGNRAASKPPAPPPADEDDDPTLRANTPAFAGASSRPARNDAANEPAVQPPADDRRKPFVRVSPPHDDPAKRPPPRPEPPPTTRFVNPVDDRAEPFIGPAHGNADAPPARPAPPPEPAPAWRDDDEPGFGARPSAPGAAHAPSANEAFPVMREPRPAAQRPSPGRKGLIAAGYVLVVVLALLFLVQLAWWQREAVMVYMPGTRALYAKVCIETGCTFSPPRYIAGLQIESSGLRQVDGPHKLELKLMLRNRADVALAYPALELTLLDDKNEVAIRRVLWPQDYARPGTIFAIGLPPQSAQPVVVRLDTGDAVAANYRVQVFYP
ncbi:DUF3426 domain-containing protein [Caballeronia concitans]|uniref:FHA domain-containing protein n=1 Tax=Caballeronia concitans TaxID=1777133 RepID=A0A658R1J7_9BURK|nr:DUF3426 domain-containing protein [Caballeronia concitans]SAL39151.1 FHA domain-containing protein [Caballeronia concitans]